MSDYFSKSYQKVRSGAGSLSGLASTMHGLHGSRVARCQGLKG